MMKTGYTKHHRSIWQNELFMKNGRCNTQYYAAWCWMVDEANIVANGIGRGELKTSRRELARMFFDGNDAKARKFLDILATHKMTANDPQTGRKLTIITICNYAKYQGDQPTTTPANHPQTTRKPPVLKEDKKSKKDSIGDLEFQEFWNAYPTSKGKALALKAWSKATKLAKPEEIIRACQEKRGGLDRDEKQYIPHAATWLNQQRWEDPLPDAETGQAESEFAKYQKRLDANWGAPPVETDEMRQIKLEMGIA